MEPVISDTLFRQLIAPYVSWKAVRCLSSSCRRDADRRDEATGLKQLSSYVDAMLLGKSHRCLRYAVAIRNTARRFGRDVQFRRWVVADGLCIGMTASGRRCRRRATRFCSCHEPATRDDVIAESTLKLPRLLRLRLRQIIRNDLSRSI